MLFHLIVTVVIVATLQPCSLCSVHLTSQSADAGVRLEVLSPHTGAVLARTFGRGTTTFIALPTPPAAEPEEPPVVPSALAATAAGGGGKAAAPAAAGKGKKGEVVAPPTAEEAAAALAMEQYKLRIALRGDATFILQVCVCCVLCAVVLCDGGV